MSNSPQGMSNRPRVLGGERRESGRTLGAFALAHSIATVIAFAPNPGCPPNPRPPPNRSQSSQSRSRWYNLLPEDAPAQPIEREIGGNSETSSDTSSVTAGSDQSYCFSPNEGTINTPLSEVPSSPPAADIPPPLILVPAPPRIPFVHRSITFPPPYQHPRDSIPDSAQIIILGPRATLFDSPVPLTSCTTATQHNVQPSGTSMQSARIIIEGLSGFFDVVERQGSIDHQSTAGSSVDPYLLARRSRYQDFPRSVHGSASADDWVICTPTATEPDLDRESWYSADPRERKLLIIGSSYEADTFRRATIDTTGTLMGASHDVRSLKSVFRRSRYDVDSLVENSFDAGTVLERVAKFLGDAEEGDVRAIIFTGHARQRTPDAPAAIILPGNEHEDPQGLITADEWEQTVRANTKPGVIVLSIFANCFSGSFMQQHVSVKDLSRPAEPEAEAADATPNAPIFITFASSRENQKTFESVVGCPCESRDSDWRYGDHFLRAFTLAARNRNFTDWQSFIKVLDNNLAHVREVGAFFAGEPNWLEENPQSAMYTSSHSLLPDLDDVMPSDIEMIDPPTPAMARIDLSEAFLAHISLCVTL